PSSGETAATPFLPGGSQDLSLDMGIYQPVGVVRVGDFVWVDANANGRQESGEPGVAGVKVTLFQAGSLPTGLTQTTDANGFYFFNNLPPGNYYVVFDLSTLPAGFAPTAQDAAGDDALDSDANPQTGQTASTGPLAAGTQNLTLDMGIYQPASLGDYVWYDRDADGIQEAGEPPVPNVTVTLYNGAGVVVGTTTTDTNGLYRFTNLRPGDYAVGFTLPPTYQFSPRDRGNDDARDSDADPATGRAVVTSLISGENDLTWDAGLTLAALGGHTWDDGQQSTADGVRAVDEKILPQVTVFLLNASGQEIARTTTDATGFYLFDPLPPGAYTVGFVLPPDYISFTITNNSSNGSDANPISGQTVLIGLEAGERDLTWDAGFVRTPVALDEEAEPLLRSLFLPVINR
ncbi:MAG: carboxypeptidase regulatory-like domain-containing protein, partial [Chloroflexota bacterium]|nr:carboxypeptidase regulatory-like domain-containing protein [Chloroflexota bacterium]